MAQEKEGWPSAMGWMTGSIFGMYVRYQADLKERDPATVWAERYRNFEESCLGYDVPTFYRGAIDGAKEAVVKLGKEDPVLVATTAKTSFDKLPLTFTSKEGIFDRI